MYVFYRLVFSPDIVTAYSLVDNGGTSLVFLWLLSYSLFSFNLSLFDHLNAMLLYHSFSQHDAQTLPKKLARTWYSKIDSSMRIFDSQSVYAGGACWCLKIVTTDC